VSAPLIWVVFPLFAAVGLWLINRQWPWTIAIATVISGLLSILALVVPIDQSIRFGRNLVQVRSTLNLLGRRLVLDQADTTFLVLVFSIGMVWFAAAWIIRAHRYFAPLGLAILALLVAAYAVQPFLYAALVFEVVVLLCVPLLLPPGWKAKNGVMRFLIFQTLALPFILFAGWASSGVEANPANEALTFQAVVLLGLGFAFLLASFPFYTWLPQMASEADPFSAGFVLSFLPTIVLVLFLEFLDNYVWLLEYPLLPGAIRFVGIVMVVSSGIWIAFEENLRRMFGYAVIFENGLALLSISLLRAPGYSLFAALLLPRLFSLGLWTYSQTLISRATETKIPALRGLFYRQPAASVGLVFALFTVCGYPLLAGFYGETSLLSNLAVESLPIVAWFLIGVTGMLAGGFRVLVTVIQRDKPGERIEEHWLDRVMVGLGIVGIILYGLVPSGLAEPLQNILTAFTRLR